MLWTVAGVLVALVVVLAASAVLIGSRLPSNHVATVKIRLSAAPERVWAIISDPHASPAWRKDVRKVERIADIDGHAAWREDSQFGVITYELTESVDRVRRTTRIADESLAFGGQWEYVITAVGTGCELAVTERGFVKPALFRFMSRFIFGYTATMRGYLAALGKSLGESAQPEVVNPGN